MQHKRMSVLLLAGLALNGQAQAADLGAYGTAGTVGVGGGLAATFGSHFGARIGYTGYQHEDDEVEGSDLTLDGTAEIGGAHALLNWHPFGGSFRMSAGAIENVSLSARVQPTGDIYVLNGATYSVNDIDEATRTAKYDSISPYAGFGFGRSLSLDGRFAFTADVGVVFTGSPTVELNATCRVPNAMLCSQIEDDVVAEEAELQRDVDELKYWPVLSLGLSYRF
jgi:hypothetical protein